jgi:hypothetical protein
MRWGTVLVLGATLTWLTWLAPGVASADGSKTDMIIYLTGGKEIRGAVVETSPGKYYVVVRSDGTTLKLPASAVRAITSPYGPPPPPEPPSEKRSEPEPPPPAASTEAPEAPRPMPKGPVAVVEMKSEKRIQLQWSPDGSGRWETACMSPCNVALPVEGGTYRIVDDRGRPGKTFQLPHDGKVTIQSIPRSTATDVMAGILMSAGGIAFLGGAGSAEDAGRNDSGPAVAVLFGLSAIALATILFSVNGASLQIDGSTKEAERVDRAPRRAFYRDGSLPALPRAMNGTLFSVRF